MTVTYKGTIVEIPPEEYRYVTQTDLKPCYTIAGGYDAHCIVCLEWAVPAAKQRAEDECFMKLMCADPDAG